MSNTNRTQEATETIRAMLSACVHIAFVAFIVAMAFAVYALGEQYGQPLIYRVLVAAGCAVSVVGHGASVTRPTTNASRTMHGLALGTWLILSLFLASLYMFISSPRLADVLPSEMVLIGAYVYALAFGIGLLTSAIALVVPSVALKPIADAAHGTIGAVITRYGETVIIVLAIAASSLHLFLFGQNVARLDLFSVIAAMVIADLAFLVAEKRVLAEMRSRKDTGRYDAFDLAAWGAFGVTVLLYLVLVNVYSVRHSAGTLDTNDAMLRTVIDFYAASPTALLTALAILSIITAFVDKRAGTPARVDVVDDVTIRQPLASRIAGSIRGARAGIEEIREAARLPLNGSGLPAPQPTRIMLQDDSSETPTLDEPKTRGVRITRQVSLDDIGDDESAGESEPRKPKSRAPSGRK